MKRKALSIVSQHQREPQEDSLERFTRLTRHLRTGSGQPLESVLLKLAAEKESQ